MKKILVFMPAYNAASTIVRVLERFPAATLARVAEILVIDNNSTDRTYERVVEYRKKKNLKKLTVLRNSRNIGYGGSKKRAFQYAIDRNHDIFVMVHSDGQYPPEKILDMARPIEEGRAELVVGSRTGELEGGMKVWKYFGNHALTFFENLVMGLHLTEFHTGFKAFDVHALAKIPIGALDNDHIITSETILQFRMRGFRVSELLIPTYYSQETTECSPGTSLKYGIGVFKLLSLYILYRLWLNFRKDFFCP